MTDRELDALVAEKVFGFTVEKVAKAWSFHDWNCSDYPTETDCLAIPNPTFKSGDMAPPAQAIPAYSSDIAAAWRVVEKMRATPSNSGGPWMLHELRECDMGRWACQFCGDFGYSPRTHADTAPKAICLAALRAVGQDV